MLLQVDDLARLQDVIRMSQSTLLVMDNTGQVRVDIEKTEQVRVEMDNAGKGYKDREQCRMDYIDREQQGCIDKEQHGS
jgi:uncharacterized protein with ATP-grasp and redox domains